MFQQSDNYISRPIKTHGRIRRVPHQGARHGTVDHGDAFDGVFLLLHLWVLPSSWVIVLRRSPFSPSSLWMASRCEWLSLSRMAAPPGTYGWRSFGCKERGAEPTLEVGQAGRLGPTGPGPSRPGSVAPSLPWVLVWLCTLPPSACTILTMSSSRPRWRFSVHEVRSFMLQSSGMFLCNTSVLATIGSDFIKLMNTNKTP
jgi:hypothetical protein